MTKPVDTKGHWSEKLDRPNKPVVIVGMPVPFCAYCGDAITQVYRTHEGKPYHPLCLEINKGDAGEGAGPLTQGLRPMADIPDNESADGSLFVEVPAPSFKAIPFIYGLGKVIPPNETWTKEDVAEAHAKLDADKLVTLEDHAAYYARVGGYSVKASEPIEPGQLVTTEGKVATPALDALPWTDKALGRKDDSEKPRWDLLPFSGLEAVAKVLTYGARKYSDNNWQHVPNPRSRYFAAAMRHLVSYQMGEKVDPESGCSHLAHATCCLLFLLWFERQGK